LPCAICSGVAGSRWTLLRRSESLFASSQRRYLSIVEAVVRHRSRGIIVSRILQPALQPVRLCLAADPRQFRAYVSSNDISSRILHSVAGGAEGFSVKAGPGRWISGCFYGQRVVHLDGCVEVEAAYYGLPPGWIGRLVRVQWDELFVRILDPKTGQLLREHLRQKRGWHRIQEQDLSPRRPWKVSQLLLRAEHAGSQIGALCHHIYQHQGQLGVRRIQGILALGRKYGTAATDDACAAALEMGVREYRFVRRYLERTPQLSLRQVDPLIRELVHYRDLIQQKTQEPNS